jgi:succinoglycan biosynthesis protein ExoV
MKLTYHEGLNFGDAINPLLFKKLLPHFFNENKKDLFLGIGSILGLKRPYEETENIVVFSSGFGANAESTYGRLPTMKELIKYDIRCVRGPLTADLLNLPKSKAICDGAILLPEFFPHKEKKLFQYSYMPHVGSFAFFSGWKPLMESLGIHLIDPRDSPIKIIKEINQTEILFAEAMHGAICADAYRVPWVPINTSNTINAFKWRDYCLSMSIDYTANHTSTLYDNDMLYDIAFSKFNNHLFSRIASQSYFFYQNMIVERQVKLFFNKVKMISPTLCQKSVLEDNRYRLLKELQSFKEDYNHLR